MIKLTKQQIKDLIKYVDENAIMLKCHSCEKEYDYFLLKDGLCLKCFEKHGIINHLLSIVEK